MLGSYLQVFTVFRVRLDLQSICLLLGPSYDVKPVMSWVVYINERIIIILLLITRTVLERMIRKLMTTNEYSQ